VQEPCCSKCKAPEIPFTKYPGKGGSKNSDYFRDSRHNINASPAINKKPGTLIHRGRIRPFIITSQPKYSRKRCKKAIIEKIIIAIVANGFTYLSLLLKMWSYSLLIVIWDINNDIRIERTERQEEYESR
jgi:hypothetical protein